MEASGGQLSYDWQITSEGLWRFRSSTSEASSLKWRRKRGRGVKSVGNQPAAYAPFNSFLTTEANTDWTHLPHEPVFPSLTYISNTNTLCMSMKWRRFSVLGRKAWLGSPACMALYFKELENNVAKILKKDEDDHITGPLWPHIFLEQAE